MRVIWGLISVLLFVLCLQVHSLMLSCSKWITHWEKHTRMSALLILMQNTSSLVQIKRSKCIVNFIIHYLPIYLQAMYCSEGKAVEIGMSNRKFSKPCEINSFPCLILNVFSWVAPMFHLSVLPVHAFICHCQCGLYWKGNIQFDWVIWSDVSFIILVLCSFVNYIS